MGAQIVRQTSVRLSQWSGMEVPTIIAADGVYTPVKLLSYAFFGSLDDSGHRKRIHRDGILDMCARHYPVQTSGGQQDMLCLKHVAIPRFLNSVSIDAYRRELQERMLDLQWEFTLGMDRIFRGEAVESDLSLLTSLVPPHQRRMDRQDQRQLFTDAQATQALRTLADRVGHIQIDLADMQRLLLLVAQASSGLEVSAPDRCPRCGYTMDPLA